MNEEQKKLIGDIIDLATRIKEGGQLVSENEALLKVIDLSSLTTIKEELNKADEILSETIELVGIEEL